MHAAFFAAGAEVAITASYQASFEGFARRGLDEAATRSLLRRSVDLAREAAAAAGGERIVAASLGPYGATLADGSEYVGRYGLGVGELADWHRPRLEALLDAGADLLAIETIPAAEEVEALAGLLAEYPEATAFVSCSCRDGGRLADGSSFADAAATAASLDGVVAVGVNCTDPAHVPSLLRSAAGVGAPLLAYPNLGARYDAATNTWNADGPRPDLAAASRAWRAAGATSVGGCCGVTPEDVAAMVSAR